MKLTVIGGAGVRAPLLIGSLAKRSREIGIEEVCIYDIDPRKIRLLTPLAKDLLERSGNPFRLTVAETPEAAVQDAKAVITTIREGFEEGRAKDERICLDHGVIGQETTGAAGFAFACRSIPALLEYARLLREADPEAWLINFTNPAGLVAQALFQSGFDRVVGICDSADTGRKYAAEHLGLAASDLQSRVAGLNHLSFTTSFAEGATERLPELLADDAFLARAQAVFPPETVRRLGGYLNEYLYYFLLKDEALSALLAEPLSRGERIVGWNANLLDTLEKLSEAERGSRGLDDYFRYVRHRNETYMEYAHEGPHHLPTDDEEGYAGVALDFLQALHNPEGERHVFCVPNRGALPFLKDDDVVEISCEVRDGQVTPIRGIELPEEARDLVRAVKRYESLAVAAILERSVETAVECLSVHPLVGDAKTARSLFEAFRKAQPQAFEGWR